MLTPHDGQVLLGGTAARGAERGGRSRGASRVVPQETHATFDFTVLDIVLMGRYPHLGPFELEGAGRSGDRAPGARRDRHGGSRGTAVRLAERRREAARRHRRRAGAGGRRDAARRADRVARSCVPDSKSAALLRRLNRTHGTTMVVCTHDLNMAAAALRRGRTAARRRSPRARRRPRTRSPPDNIRATYGVHADVHFHAEAGHLAVVPIARTS